MGNEKYCPLVSFRSGGAYGINMWTNCIGDRCNFFNNEFGRCSIWMIGNSLGRNIGGSKLEGHEGREVKK